MSFCVIHKQNQLNQSYHVALNNSLGRKRKKLDKMPDIEVQGRGIVCSQATKNHEGSAAVLRDVIHAVFLFLFFLFWSNPKFLNRNETIACCRIIFFLIN